MPQPSSNRSPMVVQAAVRRLLAVDHVLTDAQLDRLGLHGQAFPSLKLTVAPLTSSSRSHDVTFRALRPDILQTSPVRLAHLAGTAAIRHALTQPTDGWQADPGGRATRPDAVFTQDDDRWAVEFDAGYGRAAVRRKLRAFEQEYAGVIWGVASAARASHLTDRHPGLHVMTVQYW